MPVNLIGNCMECSKTAVVIVPVLHNGHRLWLCCDCLRRRGIDPRPPKHSPQQQKEPK